MLPLAVVVFIDLRVARSLTTTYESEVATVGSIARSVVNCQLKS